MKNKKTDGSVTEKPAATAKAVTATELTNKKSKLKQSKLEQVIFLLELRLLIKPM